MEFKVGDLVRSTGEYNYSFTTKDALCEVVKEEGANYMSVKIIEHKTDKSCVGNEHSVDSKNFVLEKAGKRIKEKPVDKHIVVEDSCNNSQGIYDSYDDAVDQAKSLSEKMVIYRMVRVATVQSERKVMRVRQVKITRKRKAGKRKARKK